MLNAASDETEEIESRLVRPVKILQNHHRCTLRSREASRTARNKVLEISAVRAITSWQTEASRRSRAPVQAAAASRANHSRPKESDTHRSARRQTLRPASLPTPASPHRSTSLPDPSYVLQRSFQGCELVLSFEECIEAFMEVGQCGVATMPQLSASAARHQLLAVNGSMIWGISVTFVTGIPLNSACCRIALHSRQGRCRRSCHRPRNCAATGFCRLW